MYIYTLHYNIYMSKATVLNCSFKKIKPSKEKEKKKKKERNTSKEK